MKQIKIAIILISLCLIPFSSAVSEIADAPSEKLQEVIRLIKAEQTASAKQLLAQLIAKYPDDVRLYNNLAVIYANENDLFNARDVLEDALQRDENYQSALINLGAIYSELAQRVYNRLGIENASKSDSVATNVGMDTLQPELGIATDTADYTETMAVTSVQQDTFTDDIEELIQLWATTWASQNVEAYLSFYSGGFLPRQGKDLEFWKLKRKWAILTPKWIKIGITDLSVQIEGDKARAMFKQTYASDRYQDKIVKRVDFQLEDAGWKIVKETEVEVL